MGSAAAKCSFGRVIRGTEHVRGGRDGFIRSLIDNAARPHTAKYPHPTEAIQATPPLRARRTPTSGRPTP